MEEMVFSKEDPLVELKGEKLVLKDNSKMPVLESYIEKENADFLTIKKDPTKVTFSFETDGSLLAKDVLIQSAKILEEKYAEFGKQLKSLK